MSSQNDPDRRSWTVRKPLLIGLLAIVGLFGGVFAWAATSDISGAVLGKGKVEASGNRFAVQHPVGGIAADILVKNGDKVSAGDVVLRLDDPVLHSELEAVESELFELLANEARLAAEVENRRTLTIHPILQAAAIDNPSVNTLIREQQRQLDAHFNSLNTQMSLVRTKRTQTSEEAEGVQAALAAKRLSLIHI